MLELAFSAGKRREKIRGFLRREQIVTELKEKRSKSMAGISIGKILYSNSAIEVLSYITNSYLN